MIGVEIPGIGTLKNQIVAEAWEWVAVRPVVRKSYTIARCRALAYPGVNGPG